MKALRFSGFPDALASILCLACAITLQIQLTLFSSPTYLGLRVNFTDMLAPFAGVLILGTLLLRKSVWPEWRMKHVYAWLAVITLTLAAALFNTWASYDELSRWALTNKLGGWIILMTIMGTGAWVGANAQRNYIISFVRIFLYFALGVLFYTLFIIVLRSYDWSQGWFKPDPYAFYPIGGFMANRNAYGLLMVAVFCLSTLFYFSKTLFIKNAYCYTLYFLLPMFIIFNGSRATMLTLCMVLPTMLLIHYKQHKKCLCLLLCVALGALFTLAVYANKTDKLLILSRNQAELIMEVAEVTAAQKEERGAAATASSAPLIAEKNSGAAPTLVQIGENLNYPGDSMRMTILQDSLEMIRNHPIIGSGLGSMMIYQVEKHGKLINLIDSTPIWILVEMGTIGLIIFALFYWQIVKSFWVARKTDDDFAQAYYTAMLFIIFGFTFMCLFHEIMYTRHMWFLIGLGLALKTRPAVSTV